MHKERKNEEAIILSATKRRSPLGDSFLEDGYPDGYIVE